MTEVTPRPRLGATSRLIVSAGVGMAVGVATATISAWPVATLAAWDTSLAVWMAWIWLSVGGSDAARTRALATGEDLSHVAVEVLLVSASAVNLAVVGAALIEASTHRGAQAWLIDLAAVLSVVLSWAVIHTVFALRYARMFFDRGGIAFEDGPPDYRDFAYLAFTIGAAYQVSDTPLRSKAMRREVLRHVLLSYLFGAVILATTINVVAGLFRG